MKPILCVDFDGVIHSYSSGWKGAAIIPDPPVPGALRWLAKATETFTVAIFSSRSGRSGGIKAMREYIGFWSVDPVHGMPSGFDHGTWGLLQWPTEKPAAFLSIDDRAIQFDGDWSALDPVELLDFKPWNKREFGATGTASQGLIDPTDQGDLRMGVTREGDLVRIEFGKPVAWLALPRAQAVQLAKLIGKHAGAKSISFEF